MKFEMSMNFDLVYYRTKKKKFLIKGDEVLGRWQLGVAAGVDLAPVTLIFCKSSSFDTSINILVSKKFEYAPCLLVTYLEQQNSSSGPH